MCENSATIIKGDGAHPTPPGRPPRLSRHRYQPAGHAQGGTPAAAGVLQRVTRLHRTLVQMKPIEAMEMLVKKLGECSFNAAILDRITVPTR